MGSPFLKKPLDFPCSFGIMCITTRKERENDRLEAILPSKINRAQMQNREGGQGSGNNESIRRGALFITEGRRGGDSVATFSNAAAGVYIQGV